VMVAERFLGLRLEPAGYILSDSTVKRSVNQQQPFILAYPKSQAARSIREITSKLANCPDVEEAQQSLGIRGFFNRLVSVMRI